MRAFYAGAAILHKGAVGLRLDRPALGLPAAEAAGQRAHVGVAHLLEVVAHQRAAEAASAIAHDRRRLVGNRALDVALDRALAEVLRAADPRLVPLAILARVHQDERLAGCLRLQQLRDGDLADAPLGVLDQRQETRRVMVFRLHAQALAAAAAG